MKKAALFVVLVAISLVYLPRFWTFLFAVVDFYTSYDLFECPIYERYHNFLHSFRTETTPKPLQEINASEATKEKVWELTKGHTVPLVIRGLLGNTTAVQNWHRHDWWIDNYGDEGKFLNKNNLQSGSVLICVTRVVRGLVWHSIQGIGR